LTSSPEKLLHSAKQISGKASSGKRDIAETLFIFRKSQLIIYPVQNPNRSRIFLAAGTASTTQPQLANNKHERIYPSINALGVPSRFLFSILRIYQNKKQ
jgi:hypothetical protein